MRISHIFFTLIFTCMALAHEGKLLRIGHRGAAGMAPENTLCAIEVGLAFDVDVIEVDVHHCKTGELVVIHDATVDRTTNGNGPIAEKTLREIKKLDAGDGQKIPTLQEVIEYINGRKQLNVELKGLGTAEAVAEVVHAYVQQNTVWTYDHFAISSFCHDELERFEVLCPHVETVALYYNIQSPHEIVLTPSASSIGIDDGSVTDELVKYVHDLGKKIIVYTVPLDRNPIIPTHLCVDGLCLNFLHEEE